MMPSNDFHVAFQQALSVLATAGAKNFVLIAFDASTDGNAGAVAVNATASSDVTALFHGAAEAMFPLFARLNGLPAPVAAEAMRELVYLAERKHIDQVSGKESLENGLLAGLGRSPIPES